MELHIEIENEAGIRVAVVRGEIDLYTADRFAAAIASLHQVDGPALIDLCGCPFMDSTGLHVLLRAWRARRREGRQLAISCRPKGLRRLFELTGLEATLPLYDSRTAAIEALGGEQSPLSARAS